MKCITFFMTEIQNEFSIPADHKVKMKERDKINIVEFW